MYQLNMFIGDCSISESEGFSADLQCICHLFTFQDTQWDMRVNLSCSYSSLSMLTVHICAIALKKKSLQQSVNLSSCSGFLHRKRQGFYPRHPVSLLSVSCCSCPGNTVLPEKHAAVQSELQLFLSPKLCCSISLPSFTQRLFTLYKHLSNSCTRCMQASTSK